MVMSEQKEVSIFEKLVALYKLQVLDSKIDEIRLIRGDAPQKVRDIEDELVGLKTKKENILNQIQSYESQISEKRNIIAEAKEKLKKYQEQQSKVRNNREFEALSKQIEYEELEIQVSEKKISDFNNELKKLKEELQLVEKEIVDKEQEFVSAKNELDSVVQETEAEEQRLKDIRTKVEELIEKRLLKAYLRIRKGLRNGLAVVPVLKGACNGCHNKIPLQRQLEIESKKKIIVCEFCGRILVDEEIVNIVKEEIKQQNILQLEEE